MTLPNKSPLKTKNTPNKSMRGTNKSPNTANKPFPSPNQRFQQNSRGHQNSRGRPFNRGPHQNRGSRGNNQSRPFNRGHNQSRPFTRGHNQTRPFTRGHNLGRPFTRGNNPSRPFNRGHNQSRPFTRGHNQSRPFTRGSHQNNNENSSQPENGSNFRNQPFNNNRGARGSFRSTRGARGSFRSTKGARSTFNSSRGTPYQENTFERNTPNNRGNFTNAKQGQGVKRKMVAEPDIKKHDSPEKKRRTLFVGNVPLSSTEQEIKNLFANYGTVETVRFRGVPRADIRQSKKVALIKKNFHANRTAMSAYVVFENKEAADSAQNVNGQIFKEHCLRVNLSSLKQPETSKHSIFVGNLPFDIEDDDLIELFKDCGAIDSVRIGRDKHTAMGRGFGYVNFKSDDGVELALQMENVTFKKRVLRILRADTKKEQVNIFLYLK